MKIDESVIDKVLDNKATPEEARRVAGWFVTEEGRKYLSGRLDREMFFLDASLVRLICSEYFDKK